MSDTSEVELIEGDDGRKVKLSLRKPVFFNVPSTIPEDYNPNKKAKLPREELELTWAYGYRGRDCRNNLYTLASGEVVYFVAAVAVVYSVEDHKQRFYIGHTDDIKSLAVHPGGSIVATGQVKGHDKVDDAPHVRIWDSSSMETLQVLGKGVVSRAVACLAFSKADGGSLLAVVDEASEPRMTVWEWENGEDSKVSEAKVSADPVLAVDFTKEEESRLITTGKGHIAFWVRETDGLLTRQMGVFGTHEKPKYVTSVGFTSSGETVTGDSNGSLFFWKNGGNTIENSVDGAHEGSVFSIWATEDGGLITTGKDRKIIEWSPSLEATDKSIELEEEYGAARTLTLAGETIVVGTTRNGLLKGSFDDAMAPITQGHLEELWGLAVHPTEQLFVTAGQDGTVRSVNAESHEVIWSKNLENPARSATFSPDGEVVVVGMVSGAWLVFDGSNGEEVFQGQDGDEAHQMIKFSPDGKYLALGSRTNSVYIYEVSEEFRAYTQLKELTGHSSFITHLDWSTDNETLQTNSGDYEHLLWKLSEDNNISKEENADTEWATHGCLLSFHTFGIWPEGTDGTDINSCNKANTKDVAATGDDFGYVKLFSWPVCYASARHHKYKGHSSHVTTVLFTANDTYLVSTGGRDTATLQWAVKNSDEAPE